MAMMTSYFRIIKELAEGIIVENDKTITKYRAEVYSLLVETSSEIYKE